MNLYGVKGAGRAVALVALLLFTFAEASAQSADQVRVRYTKYEYLIPMRDGVKLFAAVYVPKDTSQRYPFLLTRTPYSVGPYGSDNYRGALGPSASFEREGFIFVYQDARGRYMSEGEFQQVRPHVPNKRNPTDIDESTDTYDTIEWLLKNVPNHNGKVGMVGISQPGFHVAGSIIDSHPALKAASPQAPTADYYMGDDVYHNGAFMLAANFGFYASFVPRPGDPTPRTPEGQPVPANAVKMGGYQQLVRGEPFRGKFRNSFERPEPFKPGQPAAINFEMPDVYHAFRAGHRIMVHVQSSWFPLTDRNPQKFMDIPKATAADYQKATQRVYRARELNSSVTVSVAGTPQTFKGRQR